MNYGMVRNGPATLGKSGHGRRGLVWSVKVLLGVVALTRQAWHGSV